MRYYYVKITAYSSQTFLSTIFPINDFDGAWNFPFNLIQSIFLLYWKNNIILIENKKRGLYKRFKSA